MGFIKDQGFDLEVGTLSDEALSDLIAQHLAVKGFCSVGPGFYTVPPSQARAEAEQLDYRTVNAVVAEGLFGPEGSAGIAELEENTAVEHGPLAAVDGALTRLWHIINPYSEYIGAPMIKRSHSVLHRAGDEPESPELSEREVTKWQSQFLRHTLLLATFLGPEVGSLELRPHEDENVEPLWIRTVPGCLVLVRADMLTCKHTAPDKTLALSCFLCTGPDRRGVPTMVGRPTPVAQSLEGWTATRLRELKSMQDDGESMYDLELPRAWQSAMNHSFHRGQVAGIYSDACYLPKTDDPDQFFGRSLAGPDYAMEVPNCRWDHAAFCDPSGTHEQAIYCQHGVFMEGTELFDNKFFNLSQFEVKNMDPQARVVLEVGYNTFFNMGLPKKKLNNAPGGVFVGFTSTEWSFKGAVMNPAGSAGAACFMSGRVSFCLGMKGPSLAVSTEAASGLTATLLATESVLQKGTAVGTEFAAALSVNLLLSPVNWFTDTRSGLMSKQGRCMTFNASADGFIRSDGCCGIGLKSTGKLVNGEVVKNEDDNPVAVIAGGKMSATGESSSMTAADSAAEQQVALDAVQNAGISATDVDGVEVHGTAGQLSDAVEVHAMWRALRSGMQSERLQITSTKSSIGNQIETSGITSIMQIMHSAQRGMSAPLLHLRTVNPYMEVFELPIDCMTESLEFPFRSTFNGVKARGLGGTHAYVLAWGTLGAGLAEQEKGEYPEAESLLAPQVWAHEEEWDPKNRARFPFQGAGSGPDGGRRYYLAASWADWDLTEMVADVATPGLFHMEAELPSWGGGEFQIVQDEDWEQAFRPAQPTSDGNAVGEILGPGKEAGYSWYLDGKAAQVFRIEFQFVARHGANSYRLSWREMPSPVVDA